MTKDKFYLWLFYLLPLIYFFSLPIATGDLAVWVAHGKYLFSTHSILRHDIYSVLPTLDLVYPVLTSLLYAAIYSFAGLLGVGIFHKLLLLPIHFLWAGSLTDKIRPQWKWSGILLVLFAWFGSSMFWIERPALLAIVPFILSYHILEEDDELETKHFGALILIYIFWVNLHGSWVLLPLMYIWREFFGTLFLKRPISLKKAMFVFSLLCSSLINPFGYKVFHYVLETAAISRERRIDEWLWPDFFGAYSSQTIVFALLLFAWIALCFLKKDHFLKICSSPFSLILMLGGGSIRNTALSFFILIPFACKYFFDVIPVSGKENKSTFNWVIVILLVGVLVVFFPGFRNSFQNILPENKRLLFEKNSTPVVLTEHLNQTADRDPVFNEWDFGSYLTLKQKHPIFIDTRNIIYNQKSFDEYKQVITAAPAWADILKKYRIRYVLIKQDSHFLVSALMNSKEWEKLIEDKNAVLFKRVQK